MARWPERIWVVDDLELWACANKLVQSHGSAAWFFAAKRAEDLLEAGDLKGNSVFLAIASRIEQLQAPAPGTPLN